MKAIARLIRPMKFAIVGGIGTVIGLLLFWLFNEVLLIHVIIALVISLWLTILTNFAMNQVWTFSDRPAAKGTREVWHRLVKYHSVTIGGMIINSIVSSIIILFTTINQYLAYVIGVLVAYLWNYFFSDRWAWKAKR